MYYFRTIAGWVIHCVIQFVLLWAPFVKPLVENSYPPGWWYELWSWADWHNNLDHENRPNSALLSMYWECCWWHMRLRVDTIADGMIRSMRDYLLNIIGTIQSGFASLGNWVSAIAGRLGDILPFWATDVMAGLWHVFRIFPWVIQYGVLSWDDLWESIKEAVRDWALAFYANTVKLALDAWAWVALWGSYIRQWWQSYQAWLANFVSNPASVILAALGAAWAFVQMFFMNPAGMIMSWLAPWWDPLRTFAQDCLTFWYNIWGAYATKLSAFLSSPLDYLYDRAEAFLEDKIG